MARAQTAYESRRDWWGASILLGFVMLLVLIAATPYAYAATPSDNSYLAHLAVANAQITPQFRKTTLFYSVEVTGPISSIEIEAVPEDPAATITLLGNTNLREGVNTITIEVTAQDGSSSVYEIATFVTGTIAADDVSLRKLTIRDYVLNPSFNTAVLTYFVEVDHTVDMLEIIAIPSNTNAHVTITGNEQFVTGNNTVVVTVQSADGQKAQNYTITVHRLEQPDEAAYLRDVAGRGIRRLAPLICVIAVAFAIALASTIWLIKRRKPPCDE